MSICFNVSDSNIGLTPSVFKKGNSDCKNKVKILVNITGDVLDLYCIDYHTPPPFAKIKHSFILTQNTSKGLNRGLKFFGSFSQKIALFHRNVPFLANIERCSKFLEYALHALIYSKKNHIFANEQKCHVGKLRAWVTITAPHVL